MIFGKTKLELKVGVFVFIGFIILMVFVLSIGGFKTWTLGYRVNFIYNFVNGVKVGAPVRFSGVDVGEVERINFIFPDGNAEAKIKIVCWIKKNIKIPLDSTIWVNTLGLLGEKYIEIMPGINYTSWLKENDSFVGIDPIPMHEVFRLAKGITENLSEAIIKLKNKEGTLGLLLYDDKVYNELEAFVTDIRKNPWKLFFKTKEKK
jgi:phospholipid/cholesterol/gamma-HCH transport system substrate-binding protein